MVTIFMMLIAALAGLSFGEIYHAICKSDTVKNITNSKYTLIICVVSVLICLYFISLFNLPNKFIFSLIGIALGFLFNVLCRSHETKCPKCNKKYALVEKEQHVLSTRDTTMDVQQEIRNKKGEVTGHYTQSVPATEYKCEYTYKCKFCGNELKKIKFETYKK